MGAVEAVCRQRGVGGCVERGQAQLRAQLAVGVVSAKGRPVVVGAVVDIFTLVGGKNLPHVHKAASGGLYGGGELVEVSVLVQQRGVCRHIFLVDIRRRRGQQHVHLAGVPLAERLHRGGVLGQSAVLAVQQAEGAGEHHVLFAQQDVAVLLLLQQGGLHHALQADPLVAAEDLILHVLRVGGKVAVQPLGGKLGQGRALAEGGVFHLAVGAVRRDEVQREQADEEQAEHHQHRVVQERRRFFAVL